ncbi:MAG: sugar ABC transporter ATP-binding protein [Phycisphaerae bacterium]|nr:sugar ABC transporter ATP-binding protein [Phycisphaerae bacterium]
MNQAPIHLEMRGITKRFPGVIALQNMQLNVRGGEVLSLMGENGAGKSTLMKILGGAYQPDEGQIIIDGKPASFTGISDAKALGIALIHQELMLCGNLDIAGNIFLGNEDSALGGVGPLNSREMRRRAQALINRVGMKLPASTAVSSLTAGQMQMVEIAKSLALNARAIIMDEPTSSLTAGESAHLFEIIRQLKADGIAIIYISHRMEEVFTLSDRITVMRDGRYVGDVSRADASHDKIVSMMVGRELTQRFPDRPANPPGIDKPPVLQLQDLIVPGAPRGISFDARRGEILGFAGLVGAGRTELMQVIFGVDAANGGRMLLDGQPYFPRNTRQAIKSGVYLAPEDRKRHGLVLPMSIAQNTSLPDVQNYSGFGWLRRDVERTVANKEMNRMRIKAPTIDVKTVNLSGGNQQKVVLGKWLAMKPRVLILDEPTRGIDVGAKGEIYRTMSMLADSGITILMVSSDMEEVLGMSDRVVIMHERTIKGVLDRAQMNQDSIGRMMTGQQRVAAPAKLASDALAAHSDGHHAYREVAGNE